MMRERRLGPRFVLLGLVASALAAIGIYYVSGLLDPNRLPGSDWRSYLRNYVSADGRVIDTGNNSISHSEGQGYGLLIAVAYEDHSAFDRIWNWTRTHLQTRPGDKLLSWMWQPDANGKGGGSVPDPNNASDGDILVAWALLRAFHTWGDVSYQKAAQEILADLERLDLRPTDQGPVLLPGSVGFEKDGEIVLNPSYFIFPAFEAFAHSYPGGPWAEVEKTALLLVEQARFGKWDLAPDWLLDEEDAFGPAPDFPPVFGYNAVRIPLYLNWNTARPILTQPFAQFWNQFPDHAKIPATVNLETNAFGPDPALPGMRAVAAFAIACFRKQTLTVSSLPELTKEDSYFSASLNLLTKVAIRDSCAQK